jgi:hypothetical protein
MLAERRWKMSMVRSNSPTAALDRSDLEHRRFERLVSGHIDLEDSDCDIVAPEIAGCFRFGHTFHPHAGESDRAPHRGHSLLACGRTVDVISDTNVVREVGQTILSSSNVKPSERMGTQI